MPVSNRRVIRASILDRLVDHEPGVSTEPAEHRLLDLAQMKAAVIRDLENLLNAKRQVLAVPPACKELNRSLFVYGLKDFTAQSPRSLFMRQQLRQDIEKTISLFEPRLKNVTVQLETPAGNERNLRFRISAVLVVEPVAEPVTFDTYFDLNRGEYVISK